MVTATPDRDTSEIAHPNTKLEIGPSFNMVGEADFPGAPIDRSAEADPDTREGVARPFAEGGFDLVADAFAAPGEINGEAFALDNAGVCVPDHQLEFGAADFDPQVLVVLHVNRAESKEWEVKSERSWR